MKAVLAMLLSISLFPGVCLATDPPGSAQMLDGIYSGMARGLNATATGGSDLGVSRSYITFYPDGKVYRRVPEGGLDGWDRAASEAAVPELWGRYEPVGPGHWRIHWNNSERVSEVVREGNSLRYEDAPVLPVASCEGLALQGTYLKPGSLDSEYPPSTLTFLPGNRFIDDGLIGELAYQNITMPDPRTIGPGSGTYRIGRNTLHLSYSDGRRIPVEIHANPADLKPGPVTTIFINGWALVRPPN